jgi:hypothetical protein
LPFALFVAYVSIVAVFELWCRLGLTFCRPFDFLFETDRWTLRQLALLVAVWRRPQIQAWANWDSKGEQTPSQTIQTHAKHTKVTMHPWRWYGRWLTWCTACSKKFTQYSTALFSTQSDLQNQQLHPPIHNPQSRIIVLPPSYHNRIYPNHKPNRSIILLLVVDYSATSTSCCKDMSSWLLFAAFSFIVSNRAQHRGRCFHALRDSVWACRSQQLCQEQTWCTNIYFMPLSGDPSGTTYHLSSSARF